MGYAVYHMEKGKSYAGGIGKHIDRLAGKDNYNTFKHADPTKKHLNKTYLINEYCNKPLVLAIDARIKQGYTYHKQIRKDAIRYMTHVMTGSHEEIIEIFKNKATADTWVQANIDWMSEKYGKENIVRFTLHLDEKTPHIHAITVPITKDGGLSAKAYMGNKKDMRELQTDYAKKMESFSLNRGLMRVGVKHETATEYYARNTRIDREVQVQQGAVIEPKKVLYFTTNTDEMHTQNKDLSKKLVELTNELKQKKKSNEILENSLYKATDRITKQDQKIKEHEELLKDDVQLRNLALKAKLKNLALAEKLLKKVYTKAISILDVNSIVHFNHIRLEYNQEKEILEVHKVSGETEKILEYTREKTINILNTLKLNYSRFKSTVFKAIEKQLSRATDYISFKEKMRFDERLVVHDANKKENIEISHVQYRYRRIVLDVDSSKKILTQIDKNVVNEKIKGSFSLSDIERKLQFSFELNYNEKSKTIQASKPNDNVKLEYSEDETLNILRHIDNNRNELKKRFENDVLNYYKGEIVKGNKADKTLIIDDAIRKFAPTKEMMSNNVWDAIRKLGSEKENIEKILHQKVEEIDKEIQLKTNRKNDFEINF